MPPFEDAFSASIASGTLPGVVLLAADKSGMLQPKKTAGPLTPVIFLVLIATQAVSTTPNR